MFRKPSRIIWTSYPDARNEFVWLASRFFYLIAYVSCTTVVHRCLEKSSFHHRGTDLTAPQNYWCRVSCIHFIIWHCSSCPLPFSYPTFTLCRPKRTRQGQSRSSSHNLSCQHTRRWGGHFHLKMCWSKRPFHCQVTWYTPCWFPDLLHPPQGNSWHESGGFFSVRKIPQVCLPWDGMVTCDFVWCIRWNLHGNEPFLRIKRSLPPPPTLIHSHRANKPTLNN